MFNLFKTKKLEIPSGETKELTEVEFWTVSWSAYIYIINDSGRAKKHHKVFLKEEEAIEFIKQLEKCAKFIHTDIHTSITKN